MGAKDDPSSGGRQMPSHWGHRARHIVSQSSPTGTQCLQAVGCAEAGLICRGARRRPDGEAPRFEKDEVVYVSLGDGTTSEGEFWESLNTACTKRLPVVFLVEDNGYAISVPVEVQTPGGDVAALVRGFPGLHVDRRGRHRRREELRAMREAVAYARAAQGPRARARERWSGPTRTRCPTTSGSTRPPARARPRRRRATRSRTCGQFLLAEELATEADLTALAAEIDRELAAAADEAVKAAKPSPDSVELYVYSPDVDPTSAAFDTPAAPDGKPDTMVAAINRTLKDEMAREPADRRLRRGRGRLQPRGEPRRGVRARAACSR